MSTDKLPDNDKFGLNQYGMTVWRHTVNKNLFVERPYYWCDRIIVLDESEGRRVIDDAKFSTFDFTDWIQVTALEYEKVVRYYRDIYD